MHTDVFASIVQEQTSRRPRSAIDELWHVTGDPANRYSRNSFSNLNIQSTEHFKLLFLLSNLFLFLYSAYNTRHCSESVVFKVHVCFLVQRVSGFQSTRMFPCSESHWCFKVHVRFHHHGPAIRPPPPPPTHTPLTPHPPTQPPPSLFVFFYSPLLCTVSPSVTRSGINYCPRCFGPKTVWCC